MKTRKMAQQVHWVGAVDWDRRLFDCLIPLPDGTSYNAYLVEGADKTALLDTVDPPMVDSLMRHLQAVPSVDYVVAHHAEQDHSGAIPQVLEMYPGATVLTSKRGKGMLVDLLRIPESRIATVGDGETLSLGGKTLEFIHTPWVHWPETMVTYLQEDRILFSCDFFGSHLATSDLYVTDPGRVYEAAKRYYAEIMMPFRKVIRRNLEKLAGHQIDLIAPSHGPIYDRPSFILDAYRDWVTEEPKNVVVVAYVSMHGSTRKMVDTLVGALVEQDVTVHQFDLAATDIGKLAISLVDAATLVVGTPTVHVGPHPNVVYAASLANALRPKLKFAAVVGSYGWSSKAVEQLAALLPDLEVEILDPVLCKGFPREGTIEALANLAVAIAEKHRERGLV
jgi:flavorubredoxin